jgi:hypothetical protein
MAAHGCVGYAAYVDFTLRKRNQVPKTSRQAKNAWRLFQSGFFRTRKQTGARVLVLQTAGSERPQSAPICARNSPASIRAAEVRSVDQEAEGEPYGVVSGPEPRASVASGGVNPVYTLLSARRRRSSGFSPCSDTLILVGYGDRPPVWYGCQAPRSASITLRL